jgi:hypothetical protein
MELYVEHEKRHYGEVSSAGLFLNQSSDVIRGIINDQKRSSTRTQLMVVEPVPGSQERAISTVTKATHSAIPDNAIRCASDFKSPDVSASPEVTTKPQSTGSKSTQKITCAPYNTTINSPFTNHGHIKVPRPESKERSPKDPSPEMKAVRITDSDPQRSNPSNSNAASVTKLEAMNVDTLKNEVTPLPV